MSKNKNFTANLRNNLDFLQFCGKFHAVFMLKGAESVFDYMQKIANDTIPVHFINIKHKNIICW